MTIFEYKNFKTLPMNIQLFIEEIAGKLLKYDLISIFIFGSREFTEVSDVDLIFVVKGIEKHEMKKIKYELKSVEIKYGLRNLRDEFIGSFLNHLEEETGMFCSNFICTPQDLIEGNFSKIFNTNKFFTFLSPTNIVLSNVFQNLEILYGEDITNFLPKFRISYFQIIKSVIMCSALSFLSILLLLFSKEATKYAMEAVKWSLHNTYFYNYRNSMTIDRLISFFIKTGYNDLNKLKKLRLKYRRDVFFNLHSLPLVIKLHINCILNFH